MPRLARRLLVITAVLAVLGGLATLGVRALLNRLHLPVAQVASCDIVGTGYSLSTEQAANAATISAVALSRGLPARAATIALATALQESKLVNLWYGDRDSIGLFQQRPSQGWGTAAQIQDPHYSAGRFYDALVHVSGWQSRQLTVVAQAVQHSGDATAYQQWEPMATALAKAFEGTPAAPVNCSFPAPTMAATPARVEQLLGRDLASTPLPAAGRAGAVRPLRNGWATATWLVSYADQFGIDSVDYAAKRWTRTGGWQAEPAAPADRISFQVAAVAAAQPGQTPGG